MQNTSKQQVKHRFLTAACITVAGLLNIAWTNPSKRDEMKLDTKSRVLVIGSEGVTDPNLFQAIMADQD